MARKKGLFLHGLLLLLSLFIPLFFFILLSLSVGGALYEMLFLHSPFIFWLLMLSLRGRYLDIGEIDLYAGISSKLMFLTVALLGLWAVFRHPFHEIGDVYYWYILSGSGYAYTLPFEVYIVEIPYLIYGFMTGDWRGLGDNIGMMLVIAFNLIMLSLYLSLLYWKREYRAGAAKIIFVCGVLANIIIVFIYIYGALIYLLYLLINLSRLYSIFAKENTQEAVSI